LDILSALEARVASYPEDDLGQKYVHFLLFEREFKFVFEGLDRNRSFFWSTSPFYEREFLYRAARVPAQFKTSFRLYRYFMEALNPELVDVENTSSGPGLRLERYPISRLARELRRLTPAAVRRAWRERKMRAPTPVIECLREQVMTQAAVAEYLSPTYVNTIVAQLDGLQSHILLTLTSTIEYFVGGRSTLDRFRGTDF
jgi:hypothetical protein